MIREKVKNHPMAPDVEVVLRSTPDDRQGKTPHRICFKRYMRTKGADLRTGAITLQPVFDGRIRFFTSRLVDTKQAGWNRGSEWRGHGAGSRISMQNRLASAVNNGAPWMNIQSALAAQVRDYAGQTGDLQHGLIRAFDVVCKFADRFYMEGDRPEWPITFLLELLFFQMDTVIAGPSTNASLDAKRNLEAAVPSGNIVSSSRLYEELFLAVKDPNGMKQMTMIMFYNDLTCVEEIHEGFVALYKDSPEHHNIMVEIMAEFAQRRQNYREVCEEKNIPVHVYLSICTIAELWLTKESAVRHLGVSVPRGRSTREAATTQQRVNAVNDDLLEEVMARVAAVEQGRFREGGGVGGAPPPSQGVQRGTPTAPTALTGGLFGAARDLHPVASPFRPPSRSGSDTNETFTGKDGVKRYPGKGMPEVRINDAVEALKDAMLPRDLSIKHFNIPPGTDVNDFLSICRFEPYLIERLWDNGNCSEEVKKALAFISPAVPYGGDGEPSRPQYCEDKKVMSRNADGSESWKEQSCLHCHHAPPWKSKDGPRPLANTPVSLLFRNDVSSAHNPKPCPGRILAALTTECQPLIECIRPNPLKMAEKGL